MKTRIAFSWQDKGVLRLIREQCHEYHSALGVYVALTVIASDKESAEFQTTHQWIGQMSGLSERTVRSRLKDLAAIGAVKVIASGGLRIPNRYMLPAIGNDCRTFGKGCRTFGNGEAPPLPPSEEKKKRRVHSKPIGTAARIGAENEIKILKTQLEELKALTSEQWQRDANPELVAQKQELIAEIKLREEALIC